MMFAVAFLFFLFTVGVAFAIAVYFLINLAENLHFEEWLDAKARRAAERIKGRSNK